MEIKVGTFTYENSLGSTELKDIELDLEQSEFKKHQAGTPIEELDYGLSGTDILKAERTIALKFYEENYKNVLSGVNELDRGSLANIYKRNSCSHPVQILIMERLGMELATRGACKALYQALSSIKVKDSDMVEDNEASSRAAKARFGKDVA